MIEKIARPFEKIINSSASGSLLLLFAAIFALIWANSPYSESYFLLWQVKFSIGFAETKLYLSKSLHHWINDGFMTIFFLFVGLEIKREIIAGSLNTLKKASLPIFAAIGGVLVPLAIFLLLNDGRGKEGWGIPLATDIAFALGILYLLGDRIPRGLKVFLTAFAIVDDIIAVLIIAFFYSSNIEWTYLLYAGALLIILGYLAIKKAYSPTLWIILGTFIWLFFLKSGLHATLAGIALALTVPSRRAINLDAFFDDVEKNINRLVQKKEVLIKKDLLPEDDVDASMLLSKMGKKIVAPSQLVEHRLKDWVAYIIMPLFALANAGVALTATLQQQDIYFIVQIVVALVLGKALGISSFSWLALETGLANLPEKVTKKQILGVAFLGGVGFTMSLFISNLAFEESLLLRASKIAVLTASLIAGVTGYLIVWLSVRQKKNGIDPEAMP